MTRHRGIERGAECSDSSHGSEPGTGETERRPYRKPELVDRGRLVDLTLGGSPGVGDSAGAFTQQPPPG